MNSRSSDVVRHGQPDRAFEYNIRPAQAADLDRLVELLSVLQDHVEASNPDLWRMKPQARAQLKSQLSSRLAAPNSYALVAEHAGDGTIGVIFGRVATNNRYIPTQAGLIDQAFVREDHRRTGVGAWLVAELCCYFAAEGADALSLRYVVGNEEAAGFWTSLGFAPRIITAGASRQQVEERLAQILRS